ncbi:MAG TPA: aldolase, partial [Methanoregulaceae archaeon]|nr:aldolase [Methanoregulaceae archaeon]
SVEFERVGKRLFAESLVVANFGNMSLRSGEGFLITRSGSYLDTPGEPVFVPLSGPVPDNASSDYRVHREVYGTTDHRALVHAHPPHAIVCSLSRDRIEPVDSEGTLFCPVIRVVDGPCGSQDLAVAVARALVDAHVVVARGHGTFATGNSLDEAYVCTSLAEHSCRILVLGTLAGRDHRS